MYPIILWGGNTNITYKLGKVIKICSTCVCFILRMNSGIFWWDILVGHRHTLLERYINKGANTGKKNLADVF